MERSRRRFLSGTASSATAVCALGFGEAEAAYAELVRSWKLAVTKETRNTCPYCSVACGVMLYSKGDVSKGEKSEIVALEGDPDHPTNRGTLCPKGSGLLQFVKAKTRNLYPQIRRPGTDRFERGMMRDGRSQSTTSHSSRRSRT